MTLSVILGRCRCRNARNVQDGVSQKELDANMEFFVL